MKLTECYQQLVPIAGGIDQNIVAALPPIVPANPIVFICNLLECFPI